MEYIKIDQTNIGIAHQIQMSIFPEYDALNNYIDSLKDGAIGEYYLIREGETYIGITGIYSYQDYPLDAWLGWFGFLLEHRNKGYGKKAMEFFENLARDRGFRYVRLYTDTFDNDKAKNFYSHCGYSEERYLNEKDPASLKYPISVFSKALFDEKCPKWNNRNIHFTKQVEKQQ